MPPTPLQQAKIYLESLTRQWFEKMLPGYYLRIEYINLRNKIADAGYINRPSRVVTIRFSLPFIVANVHNIRSDAFRKLVIHELAHIPDVQKVWYELKQRDIKTPFTEKVMRVALAEQKHPSPAAQQKYQRVWHTYPPYRERVKKFGGSESIADPSLKESSVSVFAYRGHKTKVAPMQIHDYLLASCPKCRRISILSKYDKQTCKKCKIPLKTRKLKPDELIRVLKDIPVDTPKKIARNLLRRFYPRF
jgi:hypothetical protein